MCDEMSKGILSRSFCSNYTTFPWLPINITDDKLRSHAIVFFTCFRDSTITPLTPKFSREQNKFGLSSQVSEIFDKMLVRILLDVLFRVFNFFKRLLMTWHRRSWHVKISTPSWHWDVRNVAMVLFYNFTTEIILNAGPKLRSNFHSWYKDEKDER